MVGRSAGRLYRIGDILSRSPSAGRCTDGVAKSGQVESGEFAASTTLATVGAKQRDVDTTFRLVQCY